MASLCHPGFTTTKLSYRFPIFETSATALCGTTGINILQYVMYIYNIILDFFYYQDVSIFKSFLVTKMFSLYIADGQVVSMGGN